MYPRGNKFPYTNLHDLNLDWIIDTVQKCKDTVDGIVEEINAIFEKYVTKDDLTSNRKLSESGNFTGTWFGKTLTFILDQIEFGDFKGTWKGDTKEDIDALIQNGQNLYESVIALIESNPELNIEIFDGGFLSFPTDPPPEIVDLGLVSEAVTEEIDCGFVVPQCRCIGG